MATHPHDLWPPASIVITAGDLTLTPISDDDLPGLVDLALSGVHEPDRMPFYVPWTKAAPEDLPRRFAAYHWHTRSSFARDDFSLDFAVRRDGELVGAQGFGASDYPVVRTAGTGSWLAQRFQGQGIGTRMRQAVCTFLFDHLDAVRVTSGAFMDNPSSRAVSRKVGYRENGTRWVDRLGEPAEQTLLLLEPGRLVRGDDITVSGHTPLRAFLDLSVG